MPDKVTISHRGAKYEIGRTKRFYGIWVSGAPQSDPIDRWPETREGWEQAWTRFIAIETPSSITAVEQPRARFRLPKPKFRSAPAPRAGRPVRMLIGAGLLGLGVVLGVIGLFPGYLGSQSLASQADQLVPHLLYLVTWAVSAALVAVGFRSRPACTPIGALLGTGLSAVTFGLFFADLGQVIAGGTSLLGAGLLLSLIGWLACAAGSVLALTAAPAGRPAPSVPLSGEPPTGAPPSGAPLTGAPPTGEPLTGAPLTGAPLTGAPLTGAPPSGEPLTGVPLPAGAVVPEPAVPSFGTPESVRGYHTAGRPSRPRATDAGAMALVLLAAVGTVAAFAPSWDSYTLTQASTGAAETITAGNAFANPGAVIAGNVLVMVAVIGVALLAALWRPVRHGAVLLAGAIVPLAAQAISALVQASEPATPTMFGISSSQAAASGLTISSGLTPIFWVYCVFVISLLISCAWMLTAQHYPAMPAAPRPPEPAPAGPSQSEPSEAGDSDGGEEHEESSYA